MHSTALLGVSQELRLAGLCLYSAMPIGPLLVAAPPPDSVRRRRYVVIVVDRHPLALPDTRLAKLVLGRAATRFRLAFCNLFRLWLLGLLGLLWRVLDGGDIRLPI